MSILENNLQLLEYHYTSGECPIDVSLFTTRRGVVNMRFFTGERWIHVHSSYDPYKEARDMADSLDICYDSVVVVFGAGLMYLVKEILSREYTKCRILIIEPNRLVFEQILKRVDLTGLVHRMAFSIGCNRFELASILAKEITTDNFTRISTVALPAYTVKYPDEYTEFRLELKAITTRRRVESNTIVGHSILWSENAMRNVVHLPHSIRHWTFFNLLPRRPAVIVSAGPSLNKNAALINKLKDKALIIAAYSSLKTLDKYDVTPDITAAIDSIQLIRETPEEQVTPLNIPLLYTATTDHRLINKASDKIFALSHEEIYLRRLYAKQGLDDGLIYISGSVASIALDLAVISGCDPIIFVGQDLAYSNGRVHSEGVVENPINVQNKLKNAFLAEGLWGEMVLVDPVMELFRFVLEKYIRINPAPRYIDATEGGVYIAGTEVLTLEDTLKMLDVDALEGGVCQILASQFLDKSNYVPACVVEYWDEIINVSEDIIANTGIQELARGEQLSMELIRRIDSYICSKDVFNIDYRYAKTKSLELYKQKYKNEPFPQEPQEAYIIRQSIIASLLLERLKELHKIASNLKRKFYS